MSLPSLGDRLTELAEEVSAPPTSDARVAVARRTQVLRRRRRARLAAGAALVLLGAVVGGVVASRDRVPEVTTDPDDVGALPAYTLELDGWQVVVAEDTAAGAGVAPNTGSVQTFTQPGLMEGPAITLRHASVADSIVREAGEQAVGVGDVVGYLRLEDTGDVTLRWQPPLGDNVARIQARGLAESEVLAFAEGLEPKDDDGFGFPAGGSDRFGFVAGVLPRGLREVPRPESMLEEAPAHRLVARSDTGTVDLTVEPGTDGAYDGLVDELAQAGTVEHVSVGDHPAVLVGYTDVRWSLAWQPRPGVVAVTVLDGVDRAGVDEVVRGLREVTDDEWRNLVSAGTGP